MNVPPALSHAEMPNMRPKATTPMIHPGCVHTGFSFISSSANGGYNIRRSPMSRKGVA